MSFKERMYSSIYYIMILGFKAIANKILITANKTATTTISNTKWYVLITDLIVDFSIMMSDWLVFSLFSNLIFVWLYWWLLHNNVFSCWDKKRWPYLVCDISAKEKGEKKLFGFSFVPLMQEDGRTLPDGTHELIVHKVQSGVCKFIIK